MKREDIKLNMVVNAFIHNGVYHKPTDCIALEFGQGLFLTPVDNARITIPIKNFLLKDGSYNIGLVKEKYYEF